MHISWSCCSHSDCWNCFWWFLGLVFLVQIGETAVLVYANPRSCPQTRAVTFPSAKVKDVIGKIGIFEPTCAHCTVGSYASLSVRPSVRPSVCHWIIIHISASNRARDLKLYHNVHMFVLVTDCTLRKIMSANDQGTVAVTGRAHCQRQVAFLIFGMGSFWKILSNENDNRDFKSCGTFTRTHRGM